MDLLNGILSRREMSKKSTQNAADVSGETRKAVDDARSAVELQHESDHGTIIIESDGFETNEHSHTPSEIKELITKADADEEGGTQDVSRDSEADNEQEDVQNICERDDLHGLSQLPITTKRDSMEAAISLLNADVPDTNHNSLLHYATLNGHVDVVNLLLSKNANVNSRNVFGQTSLHLASEIGHLVIAQLLLDSNADVHVTDQFMNTPIHIATMHGHNELVRFLMNHSVLLICYGNRPLHLAAKCGQTEVVQLLLNYGENPDATNLDGDTPLHIASENGYFEVAEVLLRNNANANIHNASCKTPLHIAAELGHAELVRAMIDHKGEVNAVDRNGDTALHHATRNGHSSVVNVLFNQTAEIDARIGSKLAVNQVSPAELEHSQHPIRKTVDVDQTSNHAAEGGNVEIANILSSHSSTVNAVCSRQAIPHRLAVEHGHAETEQNLMFRSAKINACNNAKMTPLHLACQIGHTFIVEMLLNNHAIVDVMKQSDETPFYLAAKNGQADICDLLLRRRVCDFVHTFYIATPLHVAVKKGHIEVVKVILKHSSKISEKLTKDGKKLQKNTKRGVLPVELLKTDGRRVSAGIVWTERNIPLESKRGSGDDVPVLVLVGLTIDPKMVKLLLSEDQCMLSEMDIADSFRSITNYLEVFADDAISDDVKKSYKSDAIKCRKNLRKFSQFLINSSKFNVNHQDEQLNTFLHDMMSQNYIHLSDGCRTKESNRLRLQIQIVNELIQLLLQKGADFNMKNSDGETPLIIAAQNGCYDAIQTLFDWEKISGMKLDLDARDQYGETALIKAAEGHRVSIMRLLLSHKVSVNLYDNCGFTALHAAIYEPCKNWFDWHFFCKYLCKRKIEGDDYTVIYSRDQACWIDETEEPHRPTVVDRLRKHLEYDDKISRIKEELVNMLLGSDDTNVNVVDFRGNTPLDLVAKSFKRFTPATFEALVGRGAVRNSADLKDETPIEVATVDDRGRNILHRFIISRILYQQFASKTGHVMTDEHTKRVHLMADGISLGREKFRHLATATDDRKRTPLHYAVMTPSYGNDENIDIVSVFRKLSSHVNAADMYGKTPLHYAEEKYPYELLIKYEADENINDNFGYTVMPAISSPTVRYYRRFM